MGKGSWTCKCGRTCRNTHDVSVEGHVEAHIIVHGCDLLILHLATFMFPLLLRHDQWSSAHQGNWRMRLGQEMNDNWQSAHASGKPRTGVEDEDERNRKYRENCKQRHEAWNHIAEATLSKKFRIVPEVGVGMQWEMNHRDDEWSMLRIRSVCSMAWASRWPKKLVINAAFSELETNQNPPKRCG